MTDQQQNTSLAQSVLGWLRAGYPEGIPTQRLPADPRRAPAPR